jgi:integral membrane protein (TIGR01906 family)
VERAPVAIGLLLGGTLAALIVLVGPLALFNTWFTSTLQQRHAVADAFGTSQAEIDRVTGSFLVDVWLDGPFDASLDGVEPLLDESERSHMTDVSVLVRILGGVVILAAVLAAVSIAWLRGERRRIGRIMIVSGGLVGAVGLALGITFAVAFEPAFRIFHEIFFPPGTWLFEPGSNLITLFPQPFWFDAALAAGSTIVVAALLVTVAGLRLWRGGRAAPAAT